MGHNERCFFTFHKLCLLPQFEDFDKQHYKLAFFKFQDLGNFHLKPVFHCICGLCQPKKRWKKIVNQKYNCRGKVISK